MKDLFGTAILFFYFLKWPYFIGFPYLYLNGLNQNFILDGIWFICIGLIIKDFIAIYKRKKTDKTK